MLHEAPEKITFKNNLVFLKENPEVKIPISEVATAAYWSGFPLMHLSIYKAPESRYDHETHQGVIYIAYNYGTHLGLAFQVVDDILDVTGKTAEIGKTPGKDSAQGKVTFVSAYGLERAREIAREESRAAVEALSCFGQEANSLRLLARALLDRSS